MEIERAYAAINLLTELSCGNLSLSSDLRKHGVKLPMQNTLDIKHSAKKKHGKPSGLKRGKVQYGARSRKKV
jgi:hypothetical protein